MRNCSTADWVGRSAMGICVATVVLSALSLISNFIPFVPDYDGLAYYRLAGDLRNWLLGRGDGVLQVMHTDKWVPYWPISNGPSTYFVAVFGKLVHNNYAPIVVNTFYLLAFVAYLYRLRGWCYTLVLVVLLCANLLFFRLFTTLTTEFAVGLWLVALLVTLVEGRPRMWIALWALVVIGLLFRIVDAVFLVSIGGGYVLTQAILFRRFDAIRLVAGGMLAPALVMAVPFWYQVQAMVDYVDKTTRGLSAESWKSLAGVANRRELVERYLEYLNLYNPMVPVLFVLALVACLALPGVLRRRGLQAFVLACAAASPLLAAASLNIQVVFWVYAAMVFAAAECAWLAASQGWLPFVWRTRMVWIGAGTGMLVLATALVPAWQRESRFLHELAEYTRLSRAISQRVAMADDVRHVAMNYAGVGPVSAVGLAYAADRSFTYAGLPDIYSRNLKPAHYLAFDDRLNLFIAARDNYFFPVHFGINDHVAEIAVRMAEQGRALGFRPIAGVAKKGMTFDLWYRPGVIVYPQYEAYGDQWISKSLSVALGTPALCGADTVSGHVKLDLMFPMVAEAPDFRPPFHVQLVDERDQVVARSLVAAAGRQAVELALRNVGCGSYRVVFDQQFSTAADPRRLSALLQGHASALRFDSLR